MLPPPRQATLRVASIPNSAAAGRKSQPGRRKTMTVASPPLFLAPAKHHPGRHRPVTLSVQRKMSEQEIALDRPDCHMLAHSYVDAAPRTEREGVFVAGDEPSLLVDDEIGRASCRER